MSFLLCFLSSISDLIANCKTGYSGLFFKYNWVKEVTNGTVTFPCFLPRWWGDILTSGLIYLSHVSTQHLT